MEYEEFISEIKKMFKGDDWNSQFKLKDWRTKPGKHSFRASYYGEGQEEYERPRLYVEWETHGVSGGSCWDSSDPRPYTTNNQPEELTSLDTVLEHFSPSISFLQYRQIMALIKQGSRTQGEYYGNSTSYAFKELDLKELFDFMTGKGWLK